MSGDTELTANSFQNKTAHFSSTRFKNLFAPSKINMPLRVVALLLGILIMSAGVDIIVLADIGNSPIATCPYVLSLAFTQLSFGTFMAIWQLFLFVCQLFILRKDFKMVDILQIPLTIYYGFTTDLCAIPLQGLTCSNYIESFIVLIVGIIVLAVGIAFLVVSNTLMNCGEAFIRAISTKVKGRFGTVKIAVDISFVATGAIVALILFGHVEGAREGSFICAAITGIFVNIFSPWIAHTLERMSGYKHRSEEVVLDLSNPALKETPATETTAPAASIAHPAATQPATIAATTDEVELAN
jgi:uncharacterized membrane protein YczE